MEKKEISKLIEKLEGGFFFKVDSDERRAAARALGEIGDPSAIPALIKALRDGDSDVRANAAYALGKIRYPSAISNLIEALGDSHNNVKANAAYALGDIRDKSAVPALIKALGYYAGYGAEHVRAAAATALGNIGDPSAIPALIKALGDRGEVAEYVRAAAATALGNIGDPSAIPALIKAFGDVYGTAQFAATTAFRKIKDPSAVPALINALEDPAGDFVYNIGVRVVAARELGIVGDLRAIPVLIKVLGDGNCHVRAGAAYALGEINDMIALKSLEYLMKNDSDKRVREAAYKASLKIRSSHGIPLEEESTQKISVEGDLKYTHIGDKIGTLVKDSVVQRSNIGAGARKCPDCGREVEANEKFCLECGAKL